MRAYLDQLNQAQRAAVLDEHRAVLVNANVGSGKTTVLIAKVLYLITEKDTPLDQLIVLTFTNKAANEIKDRIKGLRPEFSDRDLPYFGTFHSVALKLLQAVLPIEKTAYTSGFTVIDPDALVSLAAKIIAEENIRIKYPAKLAKRLEASRSGRTLYGTMKAPDEIDHLLERLEEEKRRMNRMDFDDLIRYAAELAEPAVFSPDWIIVDEFQDCDRAQFELIRRLCAPRTRLFAVGDPNQVIYSWRGNSRNLFRDFKEAYGASEHSLPLNYRSSANILQAGVHLLGSSGSLVGVREEGEKVRIRNHYDAFNEAEYLAEKIKKLHRDGMAYSEVAVLYRLQRQSRSLEDSFARAGIPYSVSAKKTRKDIPVLDWFLHLLEGSANPRDWASRAAVIAHPLYGEELPAKEMRKIRSGKPSTDSALLRKMDGFLDWAKSVRTSEGIPAYFELDRHLSPTSVKYTEDKKILAQVLDSLQRRIISGEMESLREAVPDFLNRIQIYGLEAQKEEKSMEVNSVKLMTLHACKGLEFKTVFLIGANPGLLPIASATGEELEEERRLFFVGMTRARDLLEISYYTSPEERRVLPGPSEFLSRIPADLVEGDAVLKKGDVDLQALRREVSALAASSKLEVKEKRTVFHEKYGRGQVCSEDEDTIEVAFEGYGRKVFSKFFNPLSDHLPD